MNRRTAGGGGWGCGIRAVRVTALLCGRRQRWWVVHKKPGKVWVKLGLDGQACHSGDDATGNHGVFVLVAVYDGVRGYLLNEPRETLVHIIYGFRYFGWVHWRECATER